jgi:hypothetical protein
VCVAAPGSLLDDSPVTGWTKRLTPGLGREGAWVQLAELLHPISDESSSWPVFLRVEGTGSPVMAWMRQDASHPARGSLGVYRINL